MDQPTVVEERVQSSPDINFGIYFPCPECDIFYNAWQTFVVHMIVDHWWDRELADSYWQQKVSEEMVRPSRI